MLFLTPENKIHTSKVPCDFLFIIYSLCNILVDKLVTARNCIGAQAVKDLHYS